MEIGRVRRARESLRDDVCQSEQLDLHYTAPSLSGVLMLEMDMLATLASASVYCLAHGIYWVDGLQKLASKRNNTVVVYV